MSYDWRKEDAVRKLVRSGYTALPLERDPVGLLASAVGLDRDRCVQVLRELHDQGLLLGIRGEPNPALGSMHETLVCSAKDFPPVGESGAAIRWYGKTTDGSWCFSAMWARQPAEEGSRGHDFTKLGLPLHEGPLLVPSADRTYLVRDEEGDLPMLADSESQLADRLFSPMLIDPEKDFWLQVGEGIELPSGAVREAVRKLLRERVWRRFSFRFDMAALGYNGCGLAFWDLEEENLSDAARALAALGGTGDVCVRQSCDPARGNLMGLFLGREAGEGENAAESVSRQWGRPLSGWIDLELH